MDLKMSNFLPLMQALDQNNPQSGYMQRPMRQEDYTDSGIIERIKMATMKGMIHPDVANYLMQNLLEDDSASNSAIGLLNKAPNQPNPMDIVRRGLLSE